MNLKLLASPITLLIVLLCVTLPFPGCSGTGNGINNLADMIKLVPQEAVLLIHMDARQIKTDPDLDDLYDEFDLSGLIEKPIIDIDDIEKIGVALLNDGGLVFLSGDFRVDAIKEKMIEQNYDKDVYKDMEIWFTDNHDALTIHKGTIIVGDTDSIKDCIEIISGEKTSYYDKSEDSRDVIKKLPDGIIQVVIEEAYYDNALAMGMSLAKADSISLKIKGLIKFENENDARDAIGDIKKDLESDSQVSHVEAIQKQEYIEFSAEMAIEDWEWFW